MPNMEIVGEHVFSHRPRRPTRSPDTDKHPRPPDTRSTPPPTRALKQAPHHGTMRERPDGGRAKLTAVFQKAHIAYTQILDRSTLCHGPPPTLNNES